jgi:hypothetical protein
MVDEEELEDACAGLDDLGGLGVDDHAVGADRRAGGLQLRHLLHLDDADAARSVNTEGGVIAVVGDLNAVLDRRLQNGRASFDGDRLPINGQRHLIHRIDQSMIARASIATTAADLRANGSHERLTR